MAAAARLLRAPVDVLQTLREAVAGVSSAGPDEDTVLAAVEAVEAAAAAGIVLRLPNRWLPVDPGAVIGLIQNQDRLRGPLERRFGLTHTDAVLSVASAAVHGLHQRMLAPAVDLVHRVLLVRQEDSRTAAFAQVEPSLYATAPTARPPVHAQPAGRPDPRGVQRPQRRCPQGRPARARSVRRRHR